jgi:hypothetical protein
MFQLASISRAHQRCVEQLCSDGASESKISDYDHALIGENEDMSNESSGSGSDDDVDDLRRRRRNSSRSSSQQSEENANSLNLVSKPPMKLLQSQLEEHAWLMNVILSTQVRLNSPVRKKSYLLVA